MTQAARSRATQFVIGYYAILRANAVVVPVNPMNMTTELRHYVEDSGATVALCAQASTRRYGRCRVRACGTC